MVKSLVEDGLGRATVLPEVFFVRLPRDKRGTVLVLLLRQHYRCPDPSWYLYPSFQIPLKESVFRL